jgi:hypothetical protein
VGEEKQPLELMLDRKPYFMAVGTRYSEMPANRIWILNLLIYLARFAICAASGLLFAERFSIDRQVRIPVLQC